MKNIHRKFDVVAAIAMAILPLLITVYLLFLSPGDLSASQTGTQRVFGATYMTMNNPYFQILDTQIRGHLELHGDILITRDAAMDQQRQNQEIQELVDAGVCAIFMTPVQWDTAKEGVRICESLGAHDFLNSVRQIPRYPWQMPVQSLSLYALLCGVSRFKLVRPIERFPLRVGICVAEIALCAGNFVSVNFYYSGVALLVLADLVHYIRNHTIDT